MAKIAFIGCSGVKTAQLTKVVKEMDSCLEVVQIAEAEQHCNPFDPEPFIIKDICPRPIHNVSNCYPHKGFKYHK